MDTMKKLVNSGKIVITVIHQPRSSIFSLFDKILLLAEGQVVFFGSPAAALDYFNALGYHCPEHFNPADYFLDILSINIKSTQNELESRDRLLYLTSNWVEHVESTASDRHMGHHPRAQYVPSGETNVNHTCNEEHDQVSSISSWFADFSVLLWRSVANEYRNYGALLARTLTTLFFAILVSLIYRDQTYDQRSIQNRTGLLYFVLVNQVCTSLPFCF